MKDLDVIQTFYQETGQIKSNHKLEYRLKKKKKNQTARKQAEPETRVYLFVDLKEL